MERPPSHRKPWWAFAVIGMLGLPFLFVLLYGVAYWAMLTDEQYFIEPAMEIVETPDGVDFVTYESSQLEPVYRVEHASVERVFGPANQVDRWLRPDFWTIENPSPGWIFESGNLGYTGPVSCVGSPSEQLESSATEGEPASDDSSDLE